MPFPRGFGSSSMHCCREHVINVSTLYRSLTQDQYDFCYVTVNLASAKVTNLLPGTLYVFTVGGSLWRKGSQNYLNLNIVHRISVSRLSKEHPEPLHFEFCWCNQEEFHISILFHQHHCVPVSTDTTSHLHRMSGCLKLRSGTWSVFWDAQCDQASGLYISGVNNCSMHAFSCAVRAPQG